MVNLCSRIVDAFGASWVYVGWALFLGWFFGPIFAPYAVLWLSLTLLLFLWWAIDIIEQGVAWWQVLTLMAMMGISCLPAPYVWIFPIAAWVIYFFRFRDL